ncbi:SGNH/GDSL hydrolase family protein [Pontibacterium granulatum]|uniref:SGNH/GDSL hydrolase family protein n=1 Tax=Pontibacterium granulatum TaxID=2036029 RepID=UPI00249B894F|nr:SGNH/GDSL hydrolase family protein [Pontibacterium granulatum]MDI3324627.1 SGNH/GDSL hydrolase family protein [Pontibacterium granulatum]
MKNNHSNSLRNARDIEALNILAIGDCNTCGIGNQNVPDMLSQHLRTYRNMEINVTNLGAAMHTSREGMERVQEATSSGTRLLLLSFGLVDAWITSIPKLYISYYPDNPIKRQGRKLLKSLKKKLRSQTLRKLIPVGPVVEEHEFRANVSQIIEELLTTTPQLKILIWGAAPTQDEARNAILNRYDEILRDTATRYNGRYLDTKEIVKPFPRERMFDDAVHLSEEACQLVAKAMLPLAEELLKQ